MTAPGSNRTCAWTLRGNPREILALAIAHQVKLKTGAVMCLGKSALTTGYLSSFRIIHQSNPSPLKCHIDRRYKEKSSRIFSARRSLSSGFAFPGSGWDTDQLLKGDRRDHGPVCYYLAKSIIFSKTVGIYGEND